jgi:hypothetical protein
MEMHGVDRDVETISSHLEKSSSHDERLLLKKGINFAKLKNIIEKNRNKLIRAAVEVAVVICVFFIAWVYYRAKKTVTLIPTDQCGSCQGQCQSMTSLNQQGAESENNLNFAFLYKDSSGGTETTTYSNMIFAGTWSSCQLDNPLPFTQNFIYVNSSLESIPASVEQFQLKPKKGLFPPILNRKLLLFMILQLILFLRAFVSIALLKLGMVTMPNWV